MAGMMTGLLLLLLAGVTVGRVVDLQKRIIGGKTCDATDRLYHVVLIDEKGELVCGGSLISNQWILTAAHCLTPGVTLRAVLGFHQFGKIGSPLHIILIQRVPDINRIHDIALLKLTLPVSVDPVGLPDCSKPPPQIDEEVQIAGYGATQVNPNGARGNFIDPETLQCADTKVGHCNQCSPPPDYYFTLDNLICCQTTDVDMSPGDTGGGLVFKNKIYGVLSFMGLQPCVSPVAATNVCYYLAWIKVTTGIV